MLVNTKAIVISKLRYRDHDLIVKCYTEHFGIQSYLLRGVLKSKKGRIKSAYFQLLSQLELIVIYRESRSLQSIRDVKMSTIYEHIHTNISKAAIVMFIAEVLSGILKEEEKNSSLFKYLENTFLLLDKSDSVSNFHLLILLNLTKFLGFYPELNNSNFKFFNLEEGKFQANKSNKFCISNETLHDLKQFLGTNFDELNSVAINAERRRELLNVILLYFELHLGNLKKPKSVQVLNQVFA